MEYNPSNLCFVKFAYLYDCTTSVSHKYKLLAAHNIVYQSSEATAQFVIRTHLFKA